MGGGGGETNTVSKFEPPDYTVEPWKQYVSQAGELAGQETPRYEGMTVAPMSQEHVLGAGMLGNLALNGTPAGMAGRSQIYNTAMGAFDDPYATTLNPLAGENAFNEGVINRANKLSTDAFEKTMTANNRGHALSRTSGSEKQMLQQQKMADAFGEGLGANATNVLQGDINQRRGLAEAQLGRASSSLQNERNRQLQAAGMASQVQQDDLAAAQALMGVGDMRRDYGQQLLDAQAQDFWRQIQDPSVRLDLIGNALTRASGGAGTTSQQIMGGMNPMQLGAGLGMLGLGTYGMGMWG